MTVYPATLPVSPLVDSFREAIPNTVLRTEMEQGPAKVRQRTTAAVRRFSVGYVMAKAQIEILETFYLTTLQGGTLAFDFTHPRTGATVSCRFVKPPDYVPTNGNYFKVGFELEIMP
jgi:hypothetical protein